MPSKNFNLKVNTHFLLTLRINTLFLASTVVLTLFLLLSITKTTLISTIISRASQVVHHIAYDVALVTLGETEHTGKQTFLSTPNFSGTRIRAGFLLEETLRLGCTLLLVTESSISLLLALVSQ